MSWKLLRRSAAVLTIALLCSPQFATADGKGRGGGGGGGGGSGGGGMSSRGSSGGGGGMSGRSSSGNGGGGGSVRSSSAGGGSDSSSKSGDISGGSMRSGSPSSGSDRGASYFDGKSRGSSSKSDSSGGSDSKRGSSGDGSVTIRSGGDSGRNSGEIKVGKSGDNSGTKSSGAEANSITSGGNVRSNARNSDLSGGSDVKTASFLDKHSSGKGKDFDKGADKQTASTGGSLKSKGSDSDRKNELNSSKGATSSSLKAKDTKDRGSDSFLNKHDSNKSQDNKIAGLSRDRKDGDAGHSDNHWDHHDWHHGHHNNFALFIGFGTPFWGGFYDPFWGGWGWGGWGWGGWGGWGSGGWGWGGWGWPGYYPGGLAFGYHSRHFGFLYGTGWGYGYPWPYYDYDPCCVCYPGGATYVVESPTYAAVPRRTIPLATDGIASDATAAPIPSTTPSPALDPTPVVPKPDPAAADSARDFARDGEISFKKRDYKQAVREWRHALLEDPQNGTLVMMMAQAQFQTSDFNQAAGAVQAAMMLLPKDKWGVVVGNFKDLYSDSQDYVDQMKVLEKAIKDDPKNPALRFLVGFHYLYLGYPAEALRELKAGEEQAKTDQAMKELIKLAEEMTTKKSSDSSTPPPAEVPKKPDGQ